MIRVGVKVWVQLIDADWFGRSNVRAENRYVVWKGLRFR
jgi:hypothetical protein